MTRTFVGKVQLQSTNTEERAEIVVNEIRPHDVALFFDLDDDCEVAFDVPQLRLLIDNLGRALHAAQTNTGDGTEVGTVPYHWSDREGQPDSRGVVIVQARGGEVRLT